MLLRKTNLTKCTKQLRWGFGVRFEPCTQRTKSNIYPGSQSSACGTAWYQPFSCSGVSSMREISSISEDVGSGEDMELVSGVEMR